MKETLSTSFRIVSRKTTDGVEIISSARLIAHQAPNGKYCVGKQSSNTDERGHGGQGVHPFRCTQSIKDWFNNYRDFTLSASEKNRQLREFEEEYPERTNGFDVVEAAHPSFFKGK